MKKTLYPFLIILLFLSPNLWAQTKTHIRAVHPSLHSTLSPHGNNKVIHDRCGFIQSNDFNDPERKARLAAWEQVLKEKIAEKRKQRAQGNERTEETVYVIPVIVHVIHNGEPVGEGANISAEQVYSQIEVVNEDFRALNADLSDTRSQYLPLAGDTKVTFAPALVDPDGNLLEEPGIQRYNGGRAAWGVSEFDDQVKPNTQFDPYRYANFWTAALSGGLLGYAQFPLSPVVPGISLGDPSTEVFDGVVMGYQYFGSIDKVTTDQLQAGAPFNLGRTATHEIGHWLGLRHIWGDGDCSEDDFVADTPPQGSDNTGCPADDASSCGELDMWENFMDYTDDGCMSLFTQGQVDRMRTVIEMDEMRQQLMASNVPVLGSNYFTARQTQACTGSSVDFSATTEHNFSVVQWEFEGGTPATSTEENPSITYNNTGTYDVSMTVRGGENDTTIVITRENYINIQISIQSLESSYEQLFDDDQTLDQEPQWAFVGGNAWGESLPPLGALFVDNYNLDLTGQEIVATMPNVSFQGNQNAVLTFDLAYAAFGSGGTEVYDDIAILYSTDCGESFTTLAQVSGEDLSTAATMSEAFVPGQSDWKEMTFPLYEINQEGDLSGIRFAIQVFGNYGNVIWFDNIRVETFPSAPPIADFYAVPYPQPEDEGSVIKQTAVAFEDESSRNPQFWTWSFEGATPAVSSERNPRVVYEKPGVYNVSLTVSNAFGTGTLTKSSYLVVEEVEGGTSLVLANTQNNEVFDASDGFGYVAGNNNYGDAAVAEQFADPAPYTRLSQVEVGFLEATPNANGNGASSITLNVWDGTSGEPGQVLASAEIPFDEAITSAENESLVTVTFDEAISITGKFFVGIETPYNADITATPYEGDIVALRNDEVDENTAWTLFDDGTTWLPFSSEDNWGGNTTRALWVFPTLESAAVTGLANSRLSEQISVFPNPSSGQLRIDANGLRLQGYTLIDMLGKTVKQGELQNNQADLSGLPNGLYFLKLQTPKGSALKKVMLQR